MGEGKKLYEDNLAPRLIFERVTLLHEGPLIIKKKLKLIINYWFREGIGRLANCKVSLSWKKLKKKLSKQKISFFHVMYKFNC